MEGISSSLLTDQLIAGHSCQAGWSNHCGTIKRGGVPTKSATSYPAKQDEIQNIEGNSLAYNWAYVFCFISSLYPHKIISLYHLSEYSSISVHIRPANKNTFLEFPKCQTVLCCILIDEQMLEKGVKALFRDTPLVRFWWYEFPDARCFVPGDVTGGQMQFVNVYFGSVVHSTVS